MACEESGSQRDMLDPFQHQGEESITLACVLLVEVGEHGGQGVALALQRD